MLSRKNTKQYAREMEANKQRFSIKKLSVGVASVLVGLTFMGYHSNASANQVVGQNGKLNNKQNYSLSNVDKKSAQSSVVVKRTNNHTDAVQTKQSVAPQTNTKAVVQTSSSSSSTSDVRTNQTKASANSQTKAESVKSQSSFQAQSVKAQNQAKVQTPVRTQVKQVKSTDAKTDSAVQKQNLSNGQNQTKQDVKPSQSSNQTQAVKMQAGSTKTVANNNHKAVAQKIQKQTVSQSSSDYQSFKVTQAKAKSSLNQLQDARMLLASNVTDYGTLIRDYRIVEKMPDGTEKQIYHMHATLHPNKDGKYVDDLNLNNDYETDPYTKIFDYKPIEGNADTFDGVKVDELPGYTWSINDNGQHSVNGEYPGAVSVWRVNKGDNVSDSTGSYTTNSDGVMFDIFQGTVDTQSGAHYYSNVAPSQTFYVSYKPIYTTVTPDSPKTTSDVLPDNNTKNYPAGVGQNDLNKTITRTLRITAPDGKVTNVVQSVSFTRSATVDEGAGTVVSYTPWAVSGSVDSFPAYSAPAIPGYTAPSIGAETPDATWNSWTEALNYTANEQSTHINYNDEQGNLIHQDTVSGETGQTVAVNSVVPLGWKIVKGSIPKEITFTGAMTPNTNITIAHNTVTITPDNPKAPNETLPDNPTLYYPEGLTKQDLSRMITRTVDIIDPHKGKQETVQTVTFNRSATVDEVTGKATYSAWSENGTHTFVSIPVPKVAGYTASGTVDDLTVDPDSKDSTVTITYTANDVSQTIEYLDPTGKAVGGQVLTGKTDEVVPFTPQLPDGWVLKDPTQAPKSYTLQPTDTPVKFNVVHGTFKVTHDYPKKEGDLVPGTKNQHFGKGVDYGDLNKTVTRTIVITSPSGNQTIKNQTVLFTRDATVDEVTGQISYSAWSENGQHKFDAVVAPTYEGYTPNEKQADAITVTPDSKNSVEKIAYTADKHSVKILYIDQAGKVIHETDLQGTTNSTVSIPNEMPANYHAVDGMPNSVKFGTSNHADIQIKIAPNTKQVSDTKTVTRKILVHLPDGTVQTETQKVVLTRKGTQNLVTNTTDWQDWTKGQFAEYQPKDIKGYETPRADVATVDSNTKDSQLDLNYTAKQYTQMIEFVDPYGKVVKTEYVTGKTNETKPLSYQLDGYKVLDGQYLPDKVTFNGDTPNVIKVKVQANGTQDNQDQNKWPQTAPDNKPEDLPKSTVKDAQKKEYSKKHAVKKHVVKKYVARNHHKQHSRNKRVVSGYDDYQGVAGHKGQFKQVGNKSDLNSSLNNNVKAGSSQNMASKNVLNSGWTNNANAVQSAVVNNNAGVSAVGAQTAVQSASNNSEDNTLSKQSLPQTGDSSEAQLGLALLGIMATLLSVGIALDGRKKRA